MKAKGLGVLMALALCVTVGGVYATWSYAQDDVASVESEVTLSLTEKVENTRGTITVEGSVAFVLDQKSAEAGAYDYTAVLKTADESTDFAVTFTADPGAATEYANGIKVGYTLAVTGDGETFYENQALFSAFDTAQHEITMSGADGTFTGAVTADELLALMTINTFTLDTVEKYEAFQTALEGIKLTITFAEIV